MQHTFAGETIHFDLVFKRRKTIKVTVDIFGNVQVVVPKGTSEVSVLHFMEDNWSLILDKISEMKGRTEGAKVKTYEHGEKFLYQGKSYPIHISHDIHIDQDNAVFKGDKLHIFVKQLDEDRIKQALKRFYYQQCKVMVQKSIRSYQAHFKTKPRSIRITDNNTNWGTCDSQQNLTFNWKLSMAPLEVIDYVVVHEMCHMVHLNHDRSFWRLVGKIMPGYERQEQWLAISSWRMNL